ncbi:DUF2637 domain-containing protein [Gordonia alkaliphila]|uniref:DUF2637 domain-containing protein n=1 Tax=Gordonia alkaliphila TaxID=1053547 RepID=A0ABP8ZIJ6_9ACTN
MNHGRKTYGLAYAWTLVAFFTGASVLLNGAHAVLGMAQESLWARFWAVLTAILFPLAVLAETHFLVNLIREWDTRARWIAALRMVCIAAVLVVAYIAFVRSFYALGDMAGLMGIPDEDWWMLPASIDAMIILATLGVVIAEGQMALDRADAAPAQPADGSGHEHHAQLDGLAHEQVDEVPAHPVHEHPAQPVTEPAHPVDDVPAQVAEGAVAQPAAARCQQGAQDDPVALSPQVNGYAHPAAGKLDRGPAGQPAHPAGAGPAQLDDLAHEQAAHPVHDLAHEQVDEVPAHSAEGPARAVHEHPAQDAGGVDHAALAACLIAERGVDADAPVVAEVLALRAEDAAWSRIAEASGKSPSTVRRWVDGAAELDGAYAVSVGKRPKAALAVVGD